MIAAGVYLPAVAVRAALVLAIVVAAVIWAFGEAFGMILAGGGTDPNSGPLLALLALACWPAGAATPPADVDAAHLLLMAIAMAGMLAASLTTLPDTVWEAVFGLLTAWFGYRVWRDARGSGVRALAGGHCAPHLVHSGSMLYMLLALTDRLVERGVDGHADAVVGLVRSPPGVVVTVVQVADGVRRIRAGIETEIACALSNSFGFGGFNSSLVLAKTRARHRRDLVAAP